MIKPSENEIRIFFDQWCKEHDARNGIVNKMKGKLEGFEPIKSVGYAPISFKVNRKMIIKNSIELQRISHQHLVKLKRGLV